MVGTGGGGGGGHSGSSCSLGSVAAAAARQVTEDVCFAGLPSCCSSSTTLQQAQAVWDAVLRGCGGRAVCVWGGGGEGGLGSWRWPGARHRRKAFFGR